MIKLELRPYERGDAFNILLHKHFEAYSQEYFDMNALNPVAVSHTIWADQRPLGAMSMVPNMKGSADALMLVSEELQGYRGEFHKLVADKLDELIKGLELRRVQSTVQSDFEVGKKWLARLGFEQEGVLRKFGPEGQDYTIWSRI